MINEFNIDDLEQALLDRAIALSEEYSERAKRSYDHYIEDENERLRLREEREEMSAKMQAEQVYRRMVQTEELQSVKRIDQLRWQLMNMVIDDVQKQFISLTNDHESYLKLIIKGIKESVNIFTAQHLVVEFNSADQKWLKNQWQSIVDSINTNKTLKLSEKCCSGIGGFMMYDKDYKIRVNNTFEGLLERYSEEVYQIIAENLFAELTSIRSNLHDR